MRLISKFKKPRARVSATRNNQNSKQRYYNAPPRAADSSPFARKPKTPRPRPVQVGSKRRLFRRAKAIFIVIVLAIGLAYGLIVKPEAKISVNDSSYHPLADYNAAANKTLTALRNKTKLTIDKNGINKELKRQFPEIRLVNISVPVYSQVPTFKIDIAAPTFNLKSNNVLYIVGSNGVVVSDSSQLQGADNLPTLIDQSGFEATPGKQVLGTEAITFINSLLAQCKKASVAISSLTLPDSPQALHLQAEGSAYFVKFDLGGDVSLQTGQYLAAKHKFDTENSQPSQYLDVRVDGKIYYK